MAKTLTITYEEKEYKLEYTRTVARNMERAGFDINELTSKPTIMIPMLVSGAFVRHNEKIKAGTVDAIYRSLPDKDEFLRCLGIMYQDTVNELLEDPSGEDEKNSSWAASWDLEKES